MNIIVIFPIIGLIAAGIALLYLVWKMERRVKTSNTWPSVEGRILYTAIRSNLFHWPTNKEPVIEYQYNVGLEEYTSKKIFVGVKNGLMTKRAVGKLLKMFPADLPVTVYYNPQKPEDACLVKETNHSATTIAFGIFFIVFALLGFIS